ncbi:unnamed protein product [Trichobilharzia regenti]|nr:unnamed protein product [Trichobilharzia regenti]
MLILGAVWRSMTLVSNHKTTFNQSNGYEEQHVKFDHKLDDTNLSNSTTMKSVTTSAVNAPAASWNPAATGAYQYAANADEVDQLKQDELRFSQSANNEPQLILLGNNRIISRKSPQPEISEIASMIINQIYQPIQNLCLEEAEMVFFRAIIFFDPSCELLSENGRLLVRSCQYLVQMELMNLMNGKLYLPQGRFGALLLLIPDFRSITYHMIHKLQIARQMGLTKLDGLLSEILLNGSSKGKPVNSHVGSTSRCHVSKNKSVQFEEKKHSKAYSSLPKLYPEQNNSYTHVSTSPPSLPPPQPAAELPSSSPSSLSAEAMAAAAAAAAAVSTITHLTSVPIQTEMNQFTDTSLTVVDENSTSNKYIPLKSNPVVHLNLLNKDAENKSNLLETTLHQIPREEDSIKYAIEQQQQQQREEQSPSIHLGVTTASGIPVYTIMNNCENNTSHVLNDNDINNSGNENYATVKRCHFDSLAECYHCSQPVLERINEDNSDEDFNNTNDCNNTNNNNNINDNSDVEHTPMFTTHLAQETFENTQRTEYIANHCPPTLEAGVYYPDNQMYTTYSYNLNPVNVKYNQIKNIPTVYAYNDSKQLIPPENASEYMPQLISSMFTNTQS